MASRTRVRLVVLLATGLLLAAVAVLVPVAPASAQDPGLVTSGTHVLGSTVDAQVTQISRTVPYPWPSYPISRGIVIVTLPPWCRWPTPVAPIPGPGAPTPVPPTPMPSPTPGGMASAATYTACPTTVRRVPAAVVAEALAAPWTVYGYNMLQNPNTRYHPLWNPLRTQLGQMNPNVPYGPCNPVVWKASCP